MIQPERLRALNDKDVRAGDYVLYWMQASQRAESNHALQYAVRRADELRLPVVVFFGLTDSFPESNLRHYAFLLEGLAGVKEKLERAGIRLIVRAGSPDRGAAEMAERAALAVVDRGYLRIQRAWRSKAAAAMDCLLVQVESDALVPVEAASAKEEWSAATLRPKVLSRRADFLVPLHDKKPLKASLHLEFDGLNIVDPESVLAVLAVDRSVPRSRFFPGGAGEAGKRLQAFLASKLEHFADLRNNPNLDAISHLSPYLHFGQISPLAIALRTEAVSSPGKDAFLEELLVRRELSLNFVHHNPEYDAFGALPTWALKTLSAHAADERPRLYSGEELETARTHDPYWNAAQKEMTLTGKMHGYMRMYWGKKIIEWSRTPEEAFRRALYLNNRYEIDGRDPNGYAGVAWCFGKHDRPWSERPIFGTVRYMNDKGLRRKFDADQYVRRIAALGSEPQP